MYLLANQWVKPVTRGTAGFASTFHTTLDQTKKQRGNQRDKKNQRREGKRNPGKPKTRETTLNVLPAESLGITQTSVRRGKQTTMKMMISIAVHTSHGMLALLLLTVVMPPVW